MTIYQLVQMTAYTLVLIAMLVLLDKEGTKAHACWLKLLRIACILIFGVTMAIVVSVIAGDLAVELKWRIR